MASLTFKHGFTQASITVTLSPIMVAFLTVAFQVPALIPVHFFLFNSKNKKIKKQL